MRFLIAFFLLATPVMAAECPVPYSEFEENIPHIDMAACPDNKPDSEDGFCRLVMDGKRAYIYAFLYTDDEPRLFDTYSAKKIDYLMQK
ncbi:hypothetical protein N9W81_00430 [Alphaproteobacteria bacterium]|nr:hypothetical protein [Alphaproteobacteria bacterium]